MKKESSDKTRFCISHEGLTNGRKTFYIYHVSCLKIEQKTCFEKRWGSKENKFSRLLTSHVNHTVKMRSIINRSRKTTEDEDEDLSVDVDGD